MTEKEMFLNSYEREFNITSKFLNAYPEGNLDFRPHPHVQSAREIAWSFVEENRVLVSGALEGNVVFKQNPIPETLNEIKIAYESGYHEFAGAVKNLSDDAFNEMVTFGSGSDNTAPMRRGDVLWLAIMDAAHHRGQFSVYIRMVGGKAPALYENATETVEVDSKLSN